LKPLSPLQQLETRLTPTITITPLTNLPTGGAGTVLLMPDGRDLVQVGTANGTWDYLTPDAAGGYINGTFTAAASFAGGGHDDFPANVLPTDQVFVLGGQIDPTPQYSDEIYTLTSNLWSPTAAHLEGGYGDAPTALLPPDKPQPGHSPVHPEGSILAGGLVQLPIYDMEGHLIRPGGNGPNTYLYDIATGMWSPTGSKLDGAGYLETGLVQLPDTSILSYDLNANVSGFHAQRYIQVGDPLPDGSGPSPGRWWDASRLDPTNPPDLLHSTTAGSLPQGPAMVRLPKGGMALGSTLFPTLPNGAIFVVGSNGKTAFYIPPSSPTAQDDYWTAGPTVPGGLGADEGSAAVLPNGKVLLALGNAGSSAAAQLYEFDPTGASPVWTDVTAQTGISLNNDDFVRFLVNPNGHVLISQDDGGNTAYDFFEHNPDGTQTYAPGSQPTIASFTRNTGGDNSTYTLAGMLLTGADEGAMSIDEAEMSSNYPIAKLTSQTTGNVFYARTSGWTPGVAEGTTSVQVVLPRNLPKDDYHVTVVANGVESSNFVDFGGSGIGSIPWSGPIYVDTHFTMANYPSGIISDADPVMSGSQLGSLGGAGNPARNCFDNVNEGIAAALANNTWVIVNGANGTTGGTGDFSTEDVVDGSQTTNAVLLYLQAGAVDFGSLAGTSGATVDLAADLAGNPVTLTAGTDGNTKTYDGTITSVQSSTVNGSGNFIKDGDGTMTLGGTVNVATTTISGGVIKLGTANVLAGTTVIVDAFHGLDFNGLAAATLGALGGNEEVFLRSTAVTVGGDNVTIAYTGNLTADSVSPPSITKVGTGTWRLGGDGTNYYGEVDINQGTVELDSTNALFNSVVSPNATTLYGASFTGTMATSGSVATVVIGGLAGDGKVIIGNPDLIADLGVDPTSGQLRKTTFSGTLTQNATSAPTFTKDGAGTLTMTGTSSFASGYTDVVDGMLALTANGTYSLFTTGVSIEVLGILEITADGGPINPSPLQTPITMYGGTMSVDPGVTAEIENTVTGVGTPFGRGGYLDGSGTFQTSPLGGAVLTDLDATPSVTIDSKSGTDRFIEFDNNATFNVDPDLDPGSTVNFDNFKVEGLGHVTIGADSQINASNFQSFGVLTILPAVVDSGLTTLLKDVTPPPPPNQPAELMEFDSGSRTYIGTTDTAKYPSDWPDPSRRGLPTFVAGIDLNGHNAHVYQGGWFNNDGYVIDSYGAGTKTVISDGTNPNPPNAASLVKGVGFNQNSVQTVNGGTFRTGDCPGLDLFGRLTFGPGGVDNYQFQITDATGVAGPSPDAGGHVRGWGLSLVGDFTWSADSDHKVSVSLQTLSAATTEGNDVAGPMDNFDPTKGYSWAIARWSGSYSGPTDAATLNAATVFDTAGFANAAGGKFSWQLDAAAKTLSLVYTPPPAVSAVHLSTGAEGSVASLTVTFSSAVSFANGDPAAAFRLTNVDTGVTVGLSATVSTDAQGRTVVTLTFNDGALAAGHYRLSILGTAVTGSDGTALDGSGTGTESGVDYVGPTWTIGG
jgi:autotransporter-associated beta strand protein